MKKFVIAIIFAFYVLPVSVQAGGCAQNDLAVEFRLLKYFTAETPYSARIRTTIDVPNPNYTHTLEFDPINQGGVLRGTLKISKTSPDIESVQVITPIEIIENILIPRDARGVFIDVVKPYLGSPEYFMVNFPNEFKPKKPLCLSPEMYK